MTKPPCKKVAVVGSRDYACLDEVRQYVRLLPKGTVVISGGAQGVDGAAQAEAEACGLEVWEITPDYDEYGPQRAPLERNTLIAEQCDRLVAFWAPCRKCSSNACPHHGWSHGTGDVVRKAQRLGKPVGVKRATEDWRGDGWQPPAWYELGQSVVVQSDPVITARTGVVRKVRWEAGNMSWTYGVQCQDGTTTLALQRWLREVEE